MFSAQQRAEIYDAIVHQSDARVAAYCDVPFALEILGVRVRYLNLRDIATLQFSGCAFFCENSKVHVVDAIKDKSKSKTSKSSKSSEKKDEVKEAVEDLVDAVKDKSKSKTSKSGTSKSSEKKDKSKAR